AGGGRGEGVAREGGTPPDGRKQSTPQDRSERAVPRQGRRVYQPAAFPERSVSSDTSLECHRAETEVECLESVRRAALRQDLDDVLVGDRHVGRLGAIVASSERSRDTCDDEAELTVRRDPRRTKSSDGDDRALHRGS